MARQRAAKVRRVVTVTVSCPYCGSANVWNTEDRQFSYVFHEDARDGRCLDCEKTFVVSERVFYDKR